MDSETNKCTKIVAVKELIIRLAIIYSVNLTLNGIEESLI